MPFQKLTPLVVALSLCSVAARAAAPCFNGKSELSALPVGTVFTVGQDAIAHGEGIVNDTITYVGDPISHLLSCKLSGPKGEPFAPGAKLVLKDAFVKSRALWGDRSRLDRVRASFNLSEKDWDRTFLLSDGHYAHYKKTGDVSNYNGDVYDHYGDGVVGTALNPRGLEIRLDLQSPQGTATLECSYDTEVFRLERMPPKNVDYYILYGDGDAPALTIDQFQTLIYKRLGFSIQSMPSYAVGCEPAGE